MLIDTHAHIYVDQFKEDLPEIVERAKSAGLEKILMPNIDVYSIEAMKQVEQQYPNFCFSMMGLHPCSVKRESYKADLSKIKTDLEAGGYVAVGEIGIDLYWDKTTLDIQQEAFKEQIQWSINHDLPFAIHARDAFQEIFEVMDDFDAKKIKGVFHCFNGGVEEVEKINAAYPNFMFGLGGVSTFKNAGMDVSIPLIPNEKIVLETDAPYLAPVPFRGKRNEPSYVYHIAQRVADIKEMSLDRLSIITTNNAKTLFDLN